MRQLRRAAASFPGSIFLLHQSAHFHRCFSFIQPPPPFFFPRFSTESISTSIAVSCTGATSRVGTSSSDRCSFAYFVVLACPSQTPLFCGVLRFTSCSLSRLCSRSHRGRLCACRRDRRHGRGSFHGGGCLYRVGVTWRVQASRSPLCFRRFGLEQPRGARRQRRSSLVDTTATATAIAAVVTLLVAIVRRSRRIGGSA